MTPAMQESQRESLHVLSACLRYPDEGFAADLEQVRQQTALPGVTTFVREAERLRATTLQELYLHTFESDPRRSLYLSWHRYGDDPTRGRALAALNELYADAGFEPLGEELPDYVPAVLEFLAEAPPWASEVLLDGFGKELRTLAERVAADDSVYAPLMGDLARVLQPEGDSGSTVKEGGL